MSSTSNETTPAIDQAKLVSTNLRKSFLLGLILPALVLLLFWFAPAWLNKRIHSDFAQRIDTSTELSSDDKGQRHQFFDSIDFAELTWSAPPELTDLREGLTQAGLIGQFQRLAWGFGLSVLLVVILVSVMGVTLLLNRRAQRSSEDLISAYRLGWRLSLGAALAKVFLLIPLLGYGIFELTTLAADRYYPQLIGAVVLGGIIALWLVCKILLSKVRPEFTEAIAREVTPADAPALWAAVKSAAERLNTAPPEHILVGMQHNFYVTELAVNHDGGRVEGRTLFLSQPMMKQLATEEVLAIVGHELGHFIGEDTRLSREFYPLRMKIDQIVGALAASGFVGWPSVHALNFFNWSFGSSEQAMSRQREFAADRVAARLTSPEISARALVRFHVVNEAYAMGITGEDGRRLDNPYSTPLTGYIREQLLPRDTFWTELFEKKSPHPLDSHPPLRDRLESLGQSIGAQEARALSVTEHESAYGVWFEGRDELFAELAVKVDAQVGKIRNQLDVVNASYDTAEGKALLDKHFPEITWRIRGVSFWFMITCWGFLAAGLTCGVIFPQELWVKLMFATVVGLMVTGLYCTWKRHHNGTYTLRVDSIYYTGWNRPLLFSDVKNVAAMNTNGNLSVNFYLKERAPAFWLYTPLKFGSKSVTVSFASIQGKQQQNAETFFSYYTRHIEPPK